MLKTFVFTLGIAGAVSTFALGKPDINPRIAALGLSVPAVLCFGMGLASCSRRIQVVNLETRCRALERPWNAASLRLAKTLRSLWRDWEPSLCCAARFSPSLVWQFSSVFYLSRRNHDGGRSPKLDPSLNTPFPKWFENGMRDCFRLMPALLNQASALAML